MPLSFTAFTVQIGVAGAMPVHRDREKKESVAEEMEVEEQEHEASSTDEEESDTSSVSEDGDTSGEEAQKLVTVVFITC